MVQLTAKRGALALYGGLVVLPTLVLGSLQGLKILEEQEAALAAVPRATEDAERRLRDALAAQVEKLVASEQQRPFQHYASFYFPAPVGADRPTLTSSPLATSRPPPGVVAWFAFDLLERYDAAVELYWGAGVESRAGLERELDPAARLLLLHNLEEGWIKRASRIGEYETVALSLRDLATCRAREEDRECLDSQSELLDQASVEVLTSEFHLQAFQSPQGVPRVVATRRVLTPTMPDLRGLNPCLDRLHKGVGLVQGFFFDTDWLLGSLPEAMAEQVLDPSMRFETAGEQGPAPGEVEAEIRLFESLDVETYTPSDLSFGRYRLSVDTGRIEARFRGEAWRFLGMAAMLLVALSTGMALLLRSVGRELEQVRRTENFVHAVTHELRTPLSAIKLHGEMLLDGWATDEGRRKEYYRRIVRETERLSTLVERVLEKARLASGAARPFPGDLAEVVEGLRTQLADSGGTDGRDLAFDLEPELPRVLMTPEAVSSIVVNLVENARKYAPVDVAREGFEPIKVAARREGAAVLLEVSDRGPGVAPDQARRIFEAFYRVGNESTRTARGTGLGLHLVQLHAESIGGEASVASRPGGGASFRVRFRLAPPSQA